MHVNDHARRGTQQKLYKFSNTTKEGPLALFRCSWCIQILAKLVSGFSCKYYIPCTTSVGDIYFLYIPMSRKMNILIKDGKVV
jgi:hypothetical protein